MLDVPRKYKLNVPNIKAYERYPELAGKPCWEKIISSGYKDITGYMLGEYSFCDI
jgi:hypothetical protein